MSRWIKAALAAIIALPFGIALVVVLPGDHNQPASTVTVTLKGPGPDKTISVPQAAVEQAQASDVGHHEGMRDELPPNVPLKDLTAAADQQDQLAASDALPIVTPDAAPEQAGCRSRFVRNYSSRRGVRPRLWVLHYTVSSNRPGWSDVEAIDSLFNNASFAASSNYVIDNEGHCDYIVRESDKAWTQATYNPVSISVEVINTGSEPTYAEAAGLAKIAQVISDSSKRWDIPIRHGAVSGCTVTRSGIVDHSTLGACGGNHNDIGHYSIDEVIAAVQAYRHTTEVTATDRATCRKLNYWRTHGRHHGKAEHNAIRRRHALTARGVTCTSSGPVK
jgi:hypothetical protein